MNNSIHSISYKGVTIICENGLYWIATFPMRKYFSITDVQKEIDKVTKDLEQNIVTIRRIINRN